MWRHTHLEQACHFEHHHRSSCTPTHTLPHSSGHMQPCHQSACARTCHQYAHHPRIHHNLCNNGHQVSCRLFILRYTLHSPLYKGISIMVWNTNQQSCLPDSCILKLGLPPIIHINLLKDVLEPGRTSVIRMVVACSNKNTYANCVKVIIGLLDNHECTIS